MSDRNTVTVGNRQYYLSEFKKIEPSYRNDPGVLACIGKAAGHSVQTMRQVLKDLEKQLAEWDADQGKQAREREEDYLQAAQKVNPRSESSAIHWNLCEGVVFEAAVNNLADGIRAGIIRPMTETEEAALQAACERSRLFHQLQTPWRA